MPVREFTDADGREWRAWDIKPEAIHPATKAEDWLADCYITGWIVFETTKEDEKRRLCPWPIKWMDESEDGLRDLLSKAEVVPFHRLQAQREAGAESTRATSSDLGGEEPDITDLAVVRTFKYPGGRLWSACVVWFPEQGSLPVLRFTSGLRSIDLRSWRKDWADQPDEVLVSMLRRAAPRPEAGSAVPGTPRRRWDDEPHASM